MKGVGSYIAKGDHGRMQNEISEQKNNLIYGMGYKAPTPERRILGRIIPGTPGTPGIGGMQDTYRRLFDTGPNSYDDIMNNYRNFIGRDRNSAASDTYSNIASNGGVDANSMRNRAMSGVRSVYANAKRNVDRNKSISGGYSPGYNTLMSRMAREQGQNVADASTNAEAAISELSSRNRLAAASGLAGLEGMNLNADLSARNAMSNAYSGHMNDIFQAQSLQNQIAQLMLQSRVNNSQIPGNFSQAMGNIGSALGIGGRIVGGMIGLGGAPTSGFDPNGLGHY